MASPSTVITSGYGSFGSASLVLTLGFGIGSTPSASVGGGWAEAVSAYVPGAVQLTTYVPGGQRVEAFVPGAEGVN